MEPLDEDLVAAIGVRKDRAAFAELFRRHQASAFGLALRITRDRELAAEALQEAMFNVWTTASKYRKVGAVRNWILKIAARESIAALRTHHREIARRRRAEESGREPALPPEKDAEHGELSARLLGLVNALPSSDQQILGLYYAGGLSQEEIAAQLDLPQTTVSYRCKRALESLRTGLAALGFGTVALDHETLLPVLSAPKSGNVSVDEIMARLSGRLKAATSRKRNRMVANATVAILMLAGATVWWAIPHRGATTPASLKDEPLVEQTRSLVAAEAARKPLHRVWTFDGLPDGTELLLGNLNFPQVKGFPPGLKATRQQPVIVEFKDISWPRAFRTILSISSEQTPGKGGEGGLDWLAGRIRVTCKVWTVGSTPRFNVRGDPAKVELLWLDSYQIQRLGDQSYVLKQFDNRGDGRLVCWLHGMTVYQVEVQELNEEETRELELLAGRIKEDPIARAKVEPAFDLYEGKP